MGQATQVVSYTRCREWKHIFSQGIAQIQEIRVWEIDIFLFARLPNGIYFYVIHSWHLPLKMGKYMSNRKYFQRSFNFILMALNLTI